MNGSVGSSPLRRLKPGAVGSSGAVQALGTESAGRAVGRGALIVQPGHRYRYRGSIDNPVIAASVSTAPHARSVLSHLMRASESKSSMSASCLEYTTLPNRERYRHELWLSKTSPLGGRSCRHRLLGKLLN